MHAEDEYDMGIDEEEEGVRREKWWWNTKGWYAYEWWGWYVMGGGKETVYAYGLRSSMLGGHYYARRARGYRAVLGALSQKGDRVFFWERGLRVSNILHHMNWSSFEIVGSNLCWLRNLLSKSLKIDSFFPHSILWWEDMPMIWAFHFQAEIECVWALPNILFLFYDGTVSGRSRKKFDAMKRTKHAWKHTTHLAVSTVIMA